MSFQVSAADVLHSHPSSEWIKQQVYHSFGKRVEKVALIRSGLNDTYRISAEEREVYFLRLSPAGCEVYLERELKR